MPVYKDPLIVNRLTKKFHLDSHRQPHKDRRNRCNRVGGESLKRTDWLLELISY